MATKGIYKIMQLFKDDRFFFLFWGAIGLYIGLHVTRLMMLSQNFTFTRIINPDQFVLMDNLRLLFEELVSLRLKGFLYNCYFFGYGIVFWLFSFLTSLPFWLIDSQQGVVLSQRFFSFICSLSSCFILIFALRRYLKVLYVSLFVAFFFLLHPTLILWHTAMHPESLYSLFLVGTFCLLIRDNGVFKKAYYWSLVFFALAVSTKLTAIVGGILYVIYFLFYRLELRTFRVIVTSIGLFSGITFFLNSGLIFPLIRERFFRWIGDLALMNNLDNSSRLIWEKVVGIQNIYLNFYLLAALGCIGGYYLFARSLVGKKDKVAMLMALSVIGVFLFFTLLQGALGSHYAYPIFYFIFFVLALSVNRLGQFFLEKRKIITATCTFFFLAGSLVSTTSRGIAFLFYPWRSPEGSFIEGHGIYSKKQTFSDFCGHVNFVNETTSFLRLHGLENKRICVSPGGGVIKKSCRDKTTWLPVAHVDDKAIWDADVLCFRLYDKAAVISEVVGEEYFFSSCEVEKAPWRGLFEEIYEQGDFKIFLKKEL